MCRHTESFLQRLRARNTGRMYGNAQNRRATQHRLPHVSTQLAASSVRKSWQCRSVMRLAHHLRMGPQCGGWMQAHWVRIRRVQTPMPRSRRPIDTDILTLGRPHNVRVVLEQDVTFGSLLWSYAPSPLRLVARSVRSSRFVRLRDLSVITRQTSRQRTLHDEARSRAAQKRTFRPGVGIVSAAGIPH